LDARIPAVSFGAAGGCARSICLQQLMIIYMQKNKLWIGDTNNKVTINPLIWWTVAAMSESES
jgi:hypothetical protein